MPLVKIIHGLAFLGGMAITAASANGIYIHSNAPGAEMFDSVYTSLYSAEVAGIACAIAGGVALIYDIEEERKRKREKEINKRFSPGR